MGRRVAGSSATASSSTPVGRDDGESLEDGRTSRRRKYRKVIRERPGLAPAALFHLIGASIFLRLSDVASGLPPYEERVLLSSMDDEEDSTGLSQRSAYDSVFETLRAALTEALAKGSKRLLATYLQTPPGLPDGCTRGETVFDPESEEVLIQVPPLSGRSSTRRSRRSSTSSPPSGWRAAGCSSTPPIRERATSRDGWMSS